MGVGAIGCQEPILIVELQAGYILSEAEILSVIAQRQIKPGVSRVVSYPRLPVDVRHNAKINREFLSNWAAKLVNDNATKRS